MGWVLSYEYHWLPILKKRKAIREGNNPDQPVKKTVNTTEDIDNENNESSENFWMKVLD